MARILVIDDEPNIREILGHLLECIGHTPVDAGSGIEAKQLIMTDQCIDLVITDLTMPDISGIDLIKATKAERPDLPVIAVSGNSDKYPGDGLFSAGQAGPDATVQKPFALNDISSAISEVLQSTPVRC